MSDVATPAIGKAEALFKGLVWSQLIDAAMTQYGLNWWPLNTALKILTDKIFEGLRLAFDLPTITFLNEAHKAAYANAAVALKIIGQEKGIDSPEYKQAKEKAKDALAQFVRFGATT
jgi:hypothetical protein